MNKCINEVYVYVCAVVLFQMSDVRLGGATVFPNVGARIPPGNVSQTRWT